MLCFIFLKNFVIIFIESYKGAKMEELEEAIDKVIKMILESEPKCSYCNHCWYFGNKKKCKEEQQRIAKSHKDWEQRLKLWKERKEVFNYDRIKK
jgi:hypothetical protein